MSQGPNKHGLTTDIPEPVKRTVRQNAGFGCVVCGNAFVDYDHVDPEFSEAREHNANGITLLCPNCHRKKTSGFQYDTAFIKQAMENPRCKQVGFANEFFSFGNTMPFFRFGSSILHNCPVPIMADGSPLIRIDPPEHPFGPFRFTGFFFDSRGKLSLQIVFNEWRAYSDNFDVVVSGGKIVIRERARKIHLQLDCASRQGLGVDILDMYINGISFKAAGDRVEVKYDDGRYRSFTMGGVSGFPVGYMFGTNPNNEVCGIAM